MGLTVLLVLAEVEPLQGSRLDDQKPSVRGCRRDTGLWSLTPLGSAYADVGDSPLSLRFAYHYSNLLVALNCDDVQFLTEVCFIENCRHHTSFFVG